MRRKDREMDRNFALYVADKCEYMVLSMADENGMPYAVPISAVRVEDSIYFHCALSGMKTDIMRKNPKVCLVCVGDVKVVKGKFTTEYESAVIMGTALEITNHEEKISALRKICEKFTPDNMQDFDNAIVRSLNRTGIWKISIEEITGKRKKLDAKGEEMKFGRME